MGKSAPDYLLFRTGRESQMRRAINSIGTFLQGLVYSLNGSNAWQLGGREYRYPVGTVPYGVKDVWLSGYDGTSRIGLLKPHVTWTFYQGTTSLPLNTETTVYSTSLEANSITLNVRADTMIEIHVFMGDISRTGDCQVEYKVKDGSDIIYQHDILWNKVNKPASFVVYYKPTSDLTSWLPTITAKRTSGTAMSQNPMFVLLSYIGTDDFYNG